MTEEAFGRFNTPPEFGLTDEQAAERAARGLVNAPPDNISKSAVEILKDNVFTLFNLYNLLIGIGLALVGAWTNTAYLLVIALNTAVGLVQEFRARKSLNELSLLSARNANVVRGGVAREIPVGEVVLDDILILKTGEQICADCVVADGYAEADESLLTGEADSLEKSVGAPLFSGSFITGGACRARVERAGADAFINRLTADAKKRKKTPSRIQTAMRKVTRLTGFVIPPVAALLFVEAYFIRSGSLNAAAVTSAAAVLGMLPKGLVLLVSVSLAVGVINLSRKKVLVREMRALETFARADVLCLDKTGTLTEGKMTVIGFYENAAAAPPLPARDALALFLSASGGDNATARALREYFLPAKSAPPPWSATAETPFSSDRKWSSVAFGARGEFILGAPEKLVAKNTAPLTDAIKRVLDSDNRVLCAAVASGAARRGELPALEIFAAVELADPARKGAAEVLKYFAAEGAAVKIISGDNPRAAAAAARAAGVREASAFINMTGVETDADIAAAAEKYAVFGRATPDQKKRLVAAFKARGHTVAMVGDGVNDVPALREADCAVALSSGNDAARQVSQIVLTDTDFNALPAVAAEGRRVINNITKVSGVFFIKTLYSVILSALFLILNMPFPFLPVQITLIDLAIEAYPAFFMSFERETGRVRGDFLRVAVTRALPFAVLISAAVLYLSLSGKPSGEIALSAYIVTGVVSSAAVFAACFPFNKLRLFLAASSTAGFFAAAYLFRSFLSLDFSASDFRAFAVTVAPFAAAGALIAFLTVRAVRRPAR